MCFFLTVVHTHVLQLTDGELILCRLHHCLHCKKLLVYHPKPQRNESRCATYCHLLRQRLNFVTSAIISTGNFLFQILYFLLEGI